ncbi:MoaD/ThiS family protein [Cytophaga sp. FL35]|uniref:MoaD/ThiS family protein n=1 Tax=Cytophaga sp. FL35 TaxID=1904456 RepID=UPI001653C51C|nr:MoaD/ThiS family protein [Cytophaga sp. FL35]MBC6997898.1 MoaD/ThiS family protein [Cytophaga sp. FL35]
MEVLLFGIAKDIVGSSSYTISENAVMPTSVAELKQQLTTDFPELGKLSSLAVAVNSEYAEDGVLLQSQDEIALIPPVSGG